MLSNPPSCFYILHHERGMAMLPVWPFCVWSNVAIREGWKYMKLICLKLWEASGDASFLTFICMFFFQFHLCKVNSNINVTFSQIFILVTRFCITRKDWRCFTSGPVVCGFPLVFIRRKKKLWLKILWFMFYVVR